ncbi:MAG: two-component regulator propeller domain-containing protein, partial [Fidelibacterota bacterium]
MKNHTLFHSILISTMLFNVSLFSQEIRFEHIGVEQGLIFPYVTSFAQDQDGFMWLGTAGGLAKYDGYEFTNYLSDPADSNSMGTDYVWELHVDEEGMLWIGMSVGGIAKLDPKTGQFTSFRHNPKDSTSLSSDESVEFCKTRDGLFWVGTFDGAGLNLFDPESGTFKHFTHDPENPNSLGNNHINAIVEDISQEEGILWIGTYNGLNKFEYKKNRFIHYKHDPNDPNSLSDNWVEAIEMSKTGELWIGTNDGL